jgi:DNA-binding CsgD family transcriptional regulator
VEEKKSKPAISVRMWGIQMFSRVEPDEGVQRLRKIRAFAEFLRTTDATLDQILQFMALNTFSERLVITVFLATVRHDGLVSLISQFGCNEEVFAEIPDRKVSVDVPVNTALRTGAVMDCGSSTTYKFSGPGYQSRLFPNGFASSIAFPVPGIGSAYVYCAEPFELDLEAVEFLLVVGKMLSLELFRVRNLDIDLIPHRRESAPPYALTEKQWRIYEGIKEGRSNTQIASLLGVAEVVVRQEVARIMAAMKVSDREQIIKSIFPDGPGPGKHANVN